MAIIKITADSVSEIMRSAKPNRTTFYFDSELSGFGLYRTSGETGTYFAEFRPAAGGSKKRLKLGRVGTLKANEAREAARRAIANAALGKDLAQARTDERAGGTVKDLMDAYVARTRDKRKASTADGYALIAKTNLIPYIGADKAAAVTARDVQSMHTKIGAKRGRYAANRAVAVLKAAYAWGAKNEYVPKGVNPADGVERYKEEGRQRYLTPEELQRLGDALREAETIGLPYEVDAGKAKAKHAAKPENRRVKFDAHLTGAIRLLVLTGCRLREILNLRWSEVDLNRGLLQLPDSKTGKKVVVLSDASIEVFSALPRAGTYVIASRSVATEDEQPRSDLKRPWTAISKRARLDGVVLHDLRHSFASMGVDAGMSLPVIGNLLGHKSNATTQRYAHVDTNPARRAANAIAGKIADALGGSGK